MTVVFEIVERIGCKASNHVRFSGVDKRGEHGAAQYRRKEAYVLFVPIGKQLYIFNKIFTERRVFRVFERKIHFARLFDFVVQFFKCKFDLISGRRNEHIYLLNGQKGSDNLFVYVRNRFYESDKVGEHFVERFAAFIRFVVFDKTQKHIDSREKLLLRFEFVCELYIFAYVVIAHRIHIDVVRVHTELRIRFENLFCRAVP